MPRYLDPKSDIVFKKIFGNQPHLLKSFLNALLPLPIDARIESLEYLSPEQIPELPAFKTTIVDVKCCDQKGRTFIVEMQIQWVPAFLERVLFNASAAYVRQLNRGEAYKELQQVYGLALLAHNFSSDDSEWYHHYKMMNIKNHEKTLDDIQLVLVELRKFKPVTLQDKRLSVLWLRFMSEIDEKTREADSELEAVPEIAEALALAQEAAYTPKELVSYSAYWDAVSTQRTLIEGSLDVGFNQGFEAGREIGLEKGREAGLEIGVKEGRAEGRAEGRTEGRTEGRAEVIEKLKEAGVLDGKIAEVLNKYFF